MAKKVFQKDAFQNREGTNIVAEKKYDAFQVIEPKEIIRKHFIGWGDRRDRIG